MKIKSITFLFLAFIITLVACEEQHETKSASSTPRTSVGEINIDGASVVAKQAVLQYSTKPLNATPSYRYELGLLTSGFTTHYDPSQGLMVQGEGTSIWITLNGPATELSSGTYSFTDTPKTTEAFDFWYGSVNIDGERYRFTSGTIDIRQTDDGLQAVTITGKASATKGSSEEKDIHATFVGELKRFKSL